MTQDKGKITIDDIVQLNKFEEIVNSAKKMTEVNEERFNLLIDFLEQNKGKLLQRINITKYSDDTHKIKAGMEEDYHKASFPECFKFCEEKKKEYFEDEGIFLGNYLAGMPRENKSFFGHSSSWFHKEKEIFYIPSITSRDFLEVIKDYSSLDRGFAGHIHTTETVSYKKIDKKDVMAKIDLLKLTKKLKDFLAQGDYKDDFSSFHKDWSRDLRIKK